MGKKLLRRDIKYAQIDGWREGERGKERKNNREREGEGGTMSTLESCGSLQNCLTIARAQAAIKNSPRFLRFVESDVLLQWGEFNSRSNFSRSVSR